LSHLFSLFCKKGETTSRADSINEEGKLTLKNDPPWDPEKKLSFGDVVLLYITTAYYLLALP
jgi:hypothetical protein